MWHLLSFKSKFADDAMPYHMIALKKSPLRLI